MTSETRSLDARIAALPPEKRAAFEKLVASAGGPARPQAIERRARSGPVPLSFAQERLWFLDQLMPGNWLFNLSFEVPIEEPVDPELLERSVNTVVARHESLRTVFRVQDGRPVQEILPQRLIDLRLIDLRSLPEEEREPECVRLAAAESERPFKLDTGPLLRAALVRTGETSFVFVLVMHHIISDAWSLNVFWEELTQVWDGLARGREAHLPEPVVQYADFCLWEREWLSGPVLEELLQYWRRRLAGASPLALVTDRPRPALQSANGATQHARISAPVLDRLRALAREEGATLFMVLIAAFQTLLFRYTGQDDIVVGTYAANRDRREVEGLIGFFINIVPVRADLSGRPSFRRFLRQVRDSLAETYAHQALPFARLVQELVPDRDLSRNPLFQVAFQMLNMARGEFDDEQLEPQRASATLDLTCTTWETDTGLGIELEYNTDLFDASSVTELAEHYTRLLISIGQDPDRGVHELPLVDGEIRRTMLQRWNATSVEWEHDSVVSLFEAQVARTPDSPAFTAQGEVASYEQLNRRANVLARHLRALGVEEETVVGVCMPRSIDTVVSLLAVFKAGGAYLPLDSSYPAARLRNMLEQAAPRVVIGHGETLRWLPDGDAERLELEPCTELGGCEDDLGLRVSDGSLAYVIFTSGSTGRPKGVAVEHRQILNRLHWMWDAYPFAEGEVSCHKTPLNFVDSLWELLGPLLRGVPSLIVPDAVVRDPNALVLALAEARASRIWVVPSLLRALLAGHPELGAQVPELRFWVSSGEPLTAELLRLFARQVPRAVLYNLYGTSEVWDATWYDATAASPTSSRVPIGRPIANTYAYILDGSRQPAPPGVPGELHIGGAGLARAYIEDPVRTARKFVPDPFGPQPGSRLYRTGDMARYRPDGNIELLGRIDQQVTLRGYRIEPGEIDAALTEHPGIRQAVVVLRERESGSSDLVAYVVPESSDAPPSPTVLREHLRQTLPEYMLPSTFVTVPALPLTPSGKLDRGALPAPSGSRQLTAAYIAPCTPIEVGIASIWSELLGIERIGVYDSFFDLGGHSLLGVRVLSRIGEAFRVDLPLRTIFETPTIAGLALAVAESQATPAGSDTPAIVPVPRAERATTVVLETGPGGGR